ncbi:hypothetical protein SAMN05444008_102318 [Cnuella takakiae]|uniref:Uncharacterized protein n=1 Tax=Cnuella takakiae TaxID=1302690 RepID=A0A1M4VMF1_9BACT|nr:hypothetical protein [Cnuella takakiae]SHE70214.1 hypothetical protein SAMN05444008_102318 [Cnuella takakiae]
MVQTDLSQLLAECSEWRQIMRNYREEFQDSKKALQSMCRNSLSRNQLQEVEHFDNQFHIQLINIHDLKQEIKLHEKALNGEGAEHNEDLFARHEHLLDQFITLENTLQGLRSEFQEFTNTTAC